MTQKISTKTGSFLSLTTGDVGSNGYIGLIGATGITGITGATAPIINGSTGPTGNTGLTGLTGVTGPTGDIGLTGNMGSMGTEGTVGVIGLNGQTGPTGNTGIQGVTGSTGPGLTGATGATGTNGTNGTATWFKNRIINGDFSVAQRLTSGTTNNVQYASSPSQQTGLGYHSIDRWFYASQGANITGTRTASTTNGIGYMFRLAGAAGCTNLVVGQRIESIMCDGFCPGTMSLSFWAANSLLTSLSYTISYPNGTDSPGTLGSPYKTTITSGTITINSTLTQYKIENISMPMAANNGVEILFTVGAQTSGTFDLANVQVEQGSVATSFGKRSYQDELLLCQRYMMVYKASTQYEPFCIGSANSTSRVQMVFRFNTSLRGIPTMILTNITSNYLQFFGPGSWNSTSPNLQYAGTNFAAVYCDWGSITSNMGAVIYLYGNIGTPIYIAFMLEI